MAQNKQRRDENLQITIGKNLRTARQHVARMSLKEVMWKVWGVPDRKNRISEIEGGMRMPSPYILVRLSILYGVSLDFIFGLSSDIEKDLECSRAGQVIQGMREIAIDTVDRIGVLMAKQVAVMPRMEALTLKEQSLELICFLRKHVSPELIADADARQHFVDLCQQVESSCLMIDGMVAKHSRILELAMLDHINKSDNKIVNEYLTDQAVHLDQPVPNAPYRPAEVDIEDWYMSCDRGPDER